MPSHPSLIVCCALVAIGCFVQCVVGEIKPLFPGTAAGGYFLQSDVGTTPVATLVGEVLTMLAAGSAVSQDQVLPLNSPNGTFLFTFTDGPHPKEVRKTANYSAPQLLKMLVKKNKAQHKYDYVASAAPLASEATSTIGKGTSAGAALVACSTTDDLTKANKTIVADMKHIGVPSTTLLLRSASPKSTSAQATVQYDETDGLFAAVALNIMVSPPRANSSLPRIAKCRVEPDSPRGPTEDVPRGTIIAIVACFFVACFVVYIGAGVFVYKRSQAELKANPSFMVEAV